jgi:predicted Rossmann fold flavoprotein
MTKYDVAVIGAGPAGMMAAIRAAQLKKKVALLEKNDTVGRKILITGKGRCNITNSGKIDTFIEKFGKTGQFLRSALSVFSNEDLMVFLESKGLELKTERQGRVFPKSDSSHSVTDVLLRCLKENNVDIIYNARVRSIKKNKDDFTVGTDSGPITAGKVVVATGGASYKETGSSGEGFQLAQGLGHNIIPLRPGLVPLKTKEDWVKDLQGLTLKNISITFIAGKKKIRSGVGEMMMTHFGVSGPLVLDLSGDIAALLDEYKEINMLIDLKPGIKAEEMEDRLLKDFKEQGAKDIKNMLSGAMPLRLVPAIIKLTGINANKKVNQMGKDERRALAKILKALPLTITGALPIEEAMVTCGGVSIKEIDPRTMQSRIVPGLYFAGEVIEGGASSGGYNLQQAFSTGFLAGESAGNA